MLRLTTASVCLALLSLSPTPIGAQDLSTEIKDMSWIGFQQFQEVSRVFVRTNEPVEYRIDASREDLLVLILENTRVPVRNNTRALDTRYFDSPVGYIKPKVIEGPSPHVRIEITLRRRVPYKETKNDNVLAIDFSR